MNFPKPNRNYFYVVFFFFFAFYTQISQLKDNSAITDDFAASAANQQLSGYGFASFCYILGCVLLFAAAIYVSPLMCGSANEKKMLRTPTEIESGYAPYSENEKGNI
jgi:hypothetical protein